MRSAKSSLVRTPKCRDRCRYASKYGRDTDVSLSASRGGMVRWECFPGRVVGVTLDNGPCLAHHNAEYAGSVLLALLV